MTHSLLCETVTGDTMAELTAARGRAAAADMVELRLDGVRDLDVAQALHGRRAPVVVTCRPAWEGGRFDGSEEERRAVLARALTLGAEYVDLEWRAGFDDLVRANGSRVVVSSHDFAGVPDDLSSRARAMRSTGAAVIKVAVTAARLSDTLPLLEIAKGGDAVVIGMGEAGVPTRLLASRFGSRWTYGGDAVAPGQIPTTRMVEQFRFRAVGASTALYGVVGGNVMQSVSPAMHNAAFAAAGLDAVYVPLRAADFADFLVFADALGISGASVTIPFKLAALTASVSSDDLACRAGAANTIRRVHSGWEATNTDIAGFLEPLDAVWGADAPEAGADLKVRPYASVRFSVLGAGGASRAVIVALTSRGARITVHARRQDQAQEVAASTGVEAGPWPPAARSWDVLVNCTPLGGASAPDASPLPGGPFDGRLVYDLTYRPGESLLVREARRAGLRTLDGLPMLVAQAERQFAWWTGRRPARGVMQAAALAETSHRGD
ncbi:MAG: type I 3-dehydroquinate dehydratase [Acidobacteria bacterium]|nr:type I 3-dehydroquinate dehydratase [Acidobacteriota bacterium]